MTTAAKELQARYPGSKVIQFKGSFLSSGSLKTLGRLMIFLPGRDYDQFLQIGRDAHFGGKPDLGGNISQITVQKRSPDGKPLARPVLYFADHGASFRENSTEIKSIERHVSNGAQDCLGCHNQSVIPVVSPDFTPISHDPSRSGPELKTYINDIIRDYGPSVAYGRVESPGPRAPLGNASPSEDVMKECAKGLSASEMETVKRNMNCVACHNGGKRHQMIFLREFILKHVLVDSDHMIKFGALARDQRPILHRCLRADQDEKLRAKRLAYLDREFIAPCAESMRNSCGAPPPQTPPVLWKWRALDARIRELASPE